ncbi:MAG: hypothetical protein V3S29_02805, partial [bacterium]
MKLRSKPGNEASPGAGGDRRWTRRSLLKRGGVTGLVGALFGGTAAVAVGTANSENEPVSDAF